MKILLMTMGTRGDAEPFLAMAAFLKSKGHQVCCAVPEQFSSLAADSGLDYFSFDKRFMEMLDSPEAKSILGQKGSIFSRLKAIRKLFKEAMEVNDQLMREQWQIISEYNPDRILFHPKIQLAYLWGMQYPNKASFLFPLPFLMHPVKEVASIPIPINLGWFNRYTYSIINYFTAKYLLKYSKPFHRHFPNVTLKNKSVRKYMLEEAKTMYMISPQLFSKPKEWGSQIKILGYRERDKTSNWKASEDLLSFLEKQDKILFVTFGSMTNPNPEKKTQIILDLLIKHNIPAIINTGKGGLVKPKQLHGNVFFVNRIPYDWIFKKCHAVIHHGGAGTTHMAVKNECVSLIIPHAVDQFSWNKIIANAGLGPRGIPIKKMTTKRLEPLLLDVWNNAAYKKKAEAIGEQIAKEDYSTDILQFLELEQA